MWIKLNAFALSVGIDALQTNGAIRVPIAQFGTIADEANPVAGFGRGRIELHARQELARQRFSLHGENVYRFGRQFQGRRLAVGYAQLGPIEQTTMRSIGHFGV